VVARNMGDAVCCSVVQSVAVRGRVWQCVAVMNDLVVRNAVCCSLM